MNTAIRTAATLALCLPVCAFAQQDLTFSTSVDLNYKKLLLSSIFVQQTTGIATEEEFRPKLWMLNVSPSLAYRGFFLTLSFERSLGESSESRNTSGGWQDRRYSREENSITAGYNVWAGLSLFAGFLDNETTTTQINSTSSTSSAPTLFQRSRSTEKGPYYGLAYTHRVGNGSLGASYARLKADGTSDNVNSTNTGTSGRGEVTGNSFGLSWSAPLTGSLYYRFGYKGTRYDFKFTDSLGFSRRSKQNYDALYLGVANYF